MNRALAVILGVVLLDAMGIGLIFPVLPDLLKQIAVRDNIDLLYGLIISVYALMQFLFAPVLGALSDRFGRRIVMVVSLAGAAIDYLIMAFTPYLWLLVVTRMVAGLTSANIAVATAYITDISEEDDRARRFGYLHAMFGIGFILGPALGGILGEWWLRAPFLAAGILNFANMLLVILVVPESRKAAPADRLARGDFNPFRQLNWAIGVRALIPFLAIFGVLSFVGQIYGTLWALFGLEQLEWNRMTVGISLAVFGAFHALVQSTLPGVVSKRFGEKNAAIIGLSAEMSALILLSLTLNSLVVFALLPIFALGGVGEPALQSLATRAVDADSQGRLQGVLMGLASLTAIFAPIMFSAAYTFSKVQWPGFVWLAAGLFYALVIARMVPMQMGQRAHPVPAKIIEN